MKSIIVVILVVLNPFFLVFSQDNLDAYLNNSASSKDTVPVYATFKASKIINAKSNESVHKGELEVIVSHRFGDIGG
jgi:Membrane bound beta barrel domain (DUF5777)